jgi:hypothetical protein
MADKRFQILAKCSFSGVTEEEYTVVEIFIEWSSSR